MRVVCSGHPQPVSPAQQRSARTIALTPQSRAGWGLRSHLALVPFVGSDPERVSDLSPHSYPSLFPAQPPHCASGDVSPEQRFETPQLLHATLSLPTLGTGLRPCHGGLGLAGLPPVDTHWRPTTSTSHSPVAGCAGPLLCPTWLNCQQGRGPSDPPPGSSPPVESQMLPTAGGLACLAHSSACTGGGGWVHFSNFILPACTLQPLPPFPPSPVTRAAPLS